MSAELENVPQFHRERLFCCISMQNCLSLLSMFSRKDLENFSNRNTSQLQFFRQILGHPKRQLFISMPSHFITVCLRRLEKTMADIKSGQSNDNEVSFRFNSLLFIISPTKTSFRNNVFQLGPSFFITSNSPCHLHSTGC